MRPITSSLLTLVLVTGLSGCFIKPVRIFFPEQYGTHCTEEFLCVEDVEQSIRAMALYTDALTVVQRKLGNFSFRPRVIFCSTQLCFERFGFRAARAQTRGTVATVVGPRGWEGYILRHELIHQWQADRLSMFGFGKMPEWLREGMAYDLSDDPRDPLIDPWQNYRDRFRVWYGEHGKDSDLADALATVD